MSKRRTFTPQFKAKVVLVSPHRYFTRGMTLTSIPSAEWLEEEDR